MLKRFINYNKQGTLVMMMINLGFKKILKSILIKKFGNALLLYKIQRTWSQSTLARRLLMKLGGTHFEP